MSDKKPDIVDIDWMVDMDKAYELLGPEIIRCGNLDPVSVIQDRNPEEIEARTRALCLREKGRAFILSGGCEITVNTPPAHVKAMEAARV